jgi:hypothetical protein
MIEYETEFTYSEVDQASREGCPLFKAQCEHLRDLVQSNPSIPAGPLRDFLLILHSMYDDDFVAISCYWKGYDDFEQYLYVLGFEGKSTCSLTTVDNRLRASLESSNYYRGNIAMGHVWR